MHIEEAGRSVVSAEETEEEGPRRRRRFFASGSELHYGEQFTLVENFKISDKPAGIRKDFLKPYRTYTGQGRYSSSSLKACLK